MTSRATRKIAHEVTEAVDDVQHTLKKTGRRLGYEAKDAFAVTGARVGAVARTAATEAGRQSKAVVERAAREAKARPLAVAGIAAAAAALIGLLIGRGIRREA